MSGMGRLTSGLGPIKYAINIKQYVQKTKIDHEKTKMASKKCVNCDKSCICNKMAYAHCPNLMFSSLSNIFDERSSGARQHLALESSVIFSRNEVFIFQQKRAQKRID